MRQYLQHDKKSGGVGVDRRIPEKSEVKPDSEIFKGRAFAAFARAEKATTDDAQAEFLEVAVQWLKLATEAADLQDRLAPMAGESKSNPD